MRFAVAHKAATYMMVGFAYLALVVGGGIPGGIALGGMIGLVLSWWWEAPRIKLEKLSWIWTVLSIFALVYSLMAAVVTSDYLGVGAQFLIWLIVAKSYNRRAARDWQQMYLLSFLMLVAGSVLNPDLTYGLCFLGFVIASTWALTLFHLRREMEDNLLVKHAADRASERVEVRRILDSRRIVGPRFFVGTGLLSFGVFIMSAIVFLALPRVGIGFFLKSRSNVSLAGFSDGVKLGGHGVIKQDATVVMRVEIESKYGNLDAPELHWRGVAFDRYANGNWSRSGDAPNTRQTLEQTNTRDRRVLLWSNRALPVPEIDRLAANSVKQDVWLEPLDSDVLFGASNPRIIEYAHVLRRKNPIERNDEVRLEHGSTVHYTVWSDLRPPPPAKLRTMDKPLSPGFRVYLQLPPEITQRTRDLAKQITAKSTNNYDRAIAIQTWLTKNLSYTLELKDPGNQEPVDFFLFDRRKGHCEYFASGFAILARAAGVPTRQVNGFLGGEWNEYQGYVAVRAGDAHSWAEVFFPGDYEDVDGNLVTGGRWVTFDATPSAGDVEMLGRGGTGWRARLARFIDTLRFQWTKWVVEYDLVSQLQLFKGIGRMFESAAVSVKNALIAVKDWALDNWAIAGAILAAIAAIVIVRLRKKRDRLPRAEARERVRVRSTVAQTYDQAMRILAKAGYARSPSATPREHAAQMVTRGDPAGEQVAELVDVYYAAEWGAQRDPVLETRAITLAGAIRTALDEHKKKQRRRAA